MPFLKELYDFFRSRGRLESTPYVPNKKQLAEKKRSHFPFDFDRWYPQLKQYSIPSQIISISPAMAKAMTHFYAQRFLKKPLLTENDLVELRQMETQLDHIITPEAFPNGLFVRMSDRSPKDGCVLREDGQTALSSYSMALRAKELQPGKNEQIICLTALQMKQLKCNRTQQVINLLLSSERVYSDLLLALDCHEWLEHDEWSTSIILRDWLPSLEQEQEFRVFVADGVVTAISQYNHYCVFPSLVGITAESIQLLTHKMIDLVRTIHPLVHLDNYALDLAVIDGELIVIELNPLEKSTGACLFSWDVDGDVLRGKLGSLDPELRVRRDPLPHLDAVIETIMNDQSDFSDDHEPYNTWLEKHDPTVSLMPAPKWNA